jgi:hypothetical protein
MLVRPTRMLLGSLLGALLLLAVPGFAWAHDDDHGGGEAIGGGGGITFSVQDVPGGPDLISGAREPAVAPPAGTPLCGALPPEFPVTGSITVEDSATTGSDRAFGSGRVPAFGGGTGAPFAFLARSGALGQSPTGVFALGFPTGRPSAGVVTCLQVVGDTAYIGGRKGAARAGDDDD